MKNRDGEKRKENEKKFELNAFNEAEEEQGIHRDGEAGGRGVEFIEAMVCLNFYQMKRIDRRQ